MKDVIFSQIILFELKKFQKIANFTTLRKRYVGVISDNVIDFLEVGLITACNLFPFGRESKVFCLHSQGLPTVGPR